MVFPFHLHCQQTSHTTGVHSIKHELCLLPARPGAAQGLWSGGDVVGSSVHHLGHTSQPGMAHLQLRKCENAPFQAISGFFIFYFYNHHLWYWTSIASEERCNKIQI